MTPAKTYSQQQWTDQELIADGFVTYRPVKRISMMRMMPAKVVPQIFEDSAVVEYDEDGAEMEQVSHKAVPAVPRARQWMAYSMGAAVKSNENNFDPQPIEPEVFAETYRHWDDPNWEPNPTERHLQRLGCMPYYKIANIWAKALTDDTWVQDKNSAKPALAPAGAWLCVGKDGEPWMMTETGFQSDYVLPGSKNSSR